MKMSVKILLTFLLLVGSIVSGCSYSQVVTSWRDDSFPRGQLKKTLVLAVVEKNIIRWRLEDELVLQLRKLGVDAAQSYKMFPDLRGLTAREIKAGALEGGMDSVLVSRLANTRKETAYVPPTTTFSGYYGSSYSGVYSPGYTFDYKVFTLQNNLFSARDEKLVWTAVTEAEEPPSSIDDALKEYAKIIVDDLKTKKIY